MYVPTNRTVRRAGVAILVVALVVPFAITVVPELAGADRAYVVRSGSMAPTIEAGDVVLVSGTPPSEIRAGDVISYRTERTTADGRAGVVTHRVVGVEDGGDGGSFRTKGDANDRTDPGRVPASAVIGRVTFAIPLVGSVIAFAASEAGFVALVVVPLGLLVASEVVGLVRAFRADRKGPRK